MFLSILPIVATPYMTYHSHSHMSLVHSFKLWLDSCVCVTWFKTLHLHPHTYLHSCVKCNSPNTPLTLTYHSHDILIPLTHESCTLIHKRHDSWVCVSSRLFIYTHMCIYTYMWHVPHITHHSHSRITHMTYHSHSHVGLHSHVYLPLICDIWLT